MQDVLGRRAFLIEEDKQWAIAAFVGTTSAIALTGVSAVTGLGVCFTTLFMDKVCTFAVKESESRPEIRARLGLIRAFSAIAVSVVAAAALGIALDGALAVSYAAHAITATAKAILANEQDKDVSEELGFRYLLLSSVCATASAAFSPAGAAVEGFVSTFSWFMGLGPYVRILQAG